MKDSHCKKYRNKIRKCKKKQNKFHQIKMKSNQNNFHLKKRNNLNSLHQNNSLKTTRKLSKNRQFYRQSNQKVLWELKIKTKNDVLFNCVILNLYICVIKSQIKLNFIFHLYLLRVQPSFDANPFQIRRSKAKCRCKMSSLLLLARLFLKRVRTRFF